MDGQELRSKYSKLSVLVCGDMCLDKDYIGGYSGFSREVEHLPIFRTEIEKYSPGGGGNLSVCFSALGVKTIVAGVWGGGEDVNRYILERSFNGYGIDTSGMVEASRTPTFGKVYLRNGSHIFRLDLISEPITEAYENEIINRISCLSKKVDFIACADYEEANDFGVCSQRVLRSIVMNDIPKFGTSRARMNRFKGFDYMLQNTKEIMDQANFGSSSELEYTAMELMKYLDLKGITITMGGKGAISLFRDRNDSLQKMFVSSVEVAGNIDPCGCGDMFFAAYSSSIMAGYDVTTSLKIANSAARVVVRKLFGTGQASPEEIAEEFNMLYH